MTDKQIIKTEPSYTAPCVPGDTVDGEETIDKFADKSRYVELPCKVGDTVYCVDYAGEIKPRTVEAFEILEGEIGICDSSHMPCYLCTTKETEKIGSCASNIFYAGVFYTKEKAESAVKKQLEDDEKQQSVLKKVFFMKETT